MRLIFGDCKQSEFVVFFCGLPASPKSWCEDDGTRRGAVIWGRLGADTAAPGNHDHTVRDYNNRVIQFLYNNTGLDPKWQVQVPGHGMQFADLEAAANTWKNTHL